MRLIGLAKLSVSSLQNWLSNLHTSLQQMKIFEDEIVVDVKGEYQNLKLITLNGCALGSPLGARLRVKLMSNPKHLDAEKVVAKLKELLLIQ